MRCISFLLLLATLNQNSFSQFSSKLDEIYGFKSFTFKKHPQDFKNITILTKNQIHQKNVVDYKYLGTDLTFNGILIQELSLEFYKNQLYQIRVGFGNIHKEYSNDEYAIVQDALIRNFGPSYISNEEGTVSKILNSSFWMGNKVMLNHIRIDLGESKSSNGYNRIAGYMLFTETILKAQQQADELN